MPFTDTYSEATPNNSTVANQIDDEIVKTEREYRERLAVEHCFYEDETGHTDVGEHKQGSARIGRGVAGSRPVNNSNNPGSVYITEEVGTPTKIEYDNGTDWVDITDLSGALVALPDYLKKDGSVALTGNWNAGQEITATRFNGPVTGDVTGNADTATLAVNATNATDAENAVNADKLSGKNLVSVLSGTTDSIANGMTATIVISTNTSSHQYYIVSILCPATNKGCDWQLGINSSGHKVLLIRNTSGNHSYYQYSVLEWKDV